MEAMKNCQVESLIKQMKLLLKPYVRVSEINFGDLRVYSYVERVGGRYLGKFCLD